MAGGIGSKFIDGTHLTSLLRRTAASRQKQSFRRDKLRAIRGHDINEVAPDFASLDPLRCCYSPRTCALRLISWTNQSDLPSPVPLQKINRFSFPRNQIHNSPRLIP